MSHAIDPLHFRSVMGQVPTCVTVVTALVEGDQRGTQEPEPLARVVEDVLLQAAVRNVLTFSCRVGGGPVRSRR